MSDDPVERAVKAVNERFPGWSPQPSAVGYARAVAAEALRQAGEPISRENLEAELRETIGLYVREAVTRMFSEENATYRCARQIAGMLQPGYYLHRKLFSSPLPQQTALVEEPSPELDEINGRLA